MKTRKIRFISLLAVATLLVTCFCSTLSVSAENWVQTGTPMQNATITFKGMGLDGSLGETDTTLSITMYDEWRDSADAKGVGTHNSTATDRFVMIADRFAGMSTVNMWSAFTANASANMHWFVVDWDRDDRRFEIVDVYAYDGATRRAPVIPHYGFVVAFFKVFDTSYSTETTAVQAVKAGLAAGNEYVVEVNLDDMVEVIEARVKQSDSSYEITCYEELLFGVKSEGLANIKNGTASLTEVENITITSADAYETVDGYSVPHASSRLEFHPTVFNAAPNSDGIALYDSTEAYEAIAKSSLAHYFVLEPVAGKENTYKVKENYVIPTGNWTTTATKPTAVPEGGYILVLSHFVSHKISYRTASTELSPTTRAALFQYKNIDTYFAAGKEFVIDIKAAVKTINAGQVRFDNPTGLRFKTQITGWQKMVNDGYTLEAGTLIMPKDLLDATGKGFTIDALGAENAGSTYLDVKQTKWAVDPTESVDAIGEMQAAIVNIKTGNYGRTFAARGYVKATKDGVTEYIYSDTITYRSVREVADAALADEECDTKYSEVLQEILRGFATPQA